jgi:hypothetical protein
MGNLQYTTETIFLAKKLCDECFECNFDTGDLRKAARDKYNALKDVVLN